MPGARHARFSAPVLVVTIAALVFGAMGVAPPTVRAVSTSVVISQVYGGGGNSGAMYQNDFIELYNLGSTAVSVTGWTVPLRTVLDQLVPALEAYWTDHPVKSTAAEPRL